ncbi:hypothetical protein [Collinsella tanakaei]|uniref:hypothetical protein n=1 Tax=Collinsella tanakaei TaxID=626935 RepID=UPI002F93C029
MDFMNEYVNGQLANPQFVNPYEEAATYERVERTGKSRRLSDALVSMLAMVVLCIGAVSVLSKLGR